ncbi:Pol-like protein [Metarhizium anisopliae]|nr:Pol-like protein [Metarhizium anisopliae]
MDSKRIYVNIGLNKENYTTAFINCGCLTYATMSEAFAQKTGLPRIPITPRDLTQVNTAVKSTIKTVTFADINIDRYRKKRVFFYVIPNQDNDIILGKTWIEEEDVTLQPTRGLLHIGSQDH